MKNVSAALVNTYSCMTVHTVVIIVDLKRNIPEDEPTLYRVGCHNEEHNLYVPLGIADIQDLTITVQLSGLLPLLSYTCCASAVYAEYVGRGVCYNIETPNLFSTTESSANSVSIVGGVLGVVIAILIILLTLTGTALLCQLRPELKGFVIPKQRYNNISILLSLEKVLGTSNKIVCHNNYR